ncbi:hypothetical protein [Streptomyces shenzhenensis]|uniref:hypothetical protein n=1 Tax=Streptomyces shenzhenensis TaxID=943815 RepID=UPI001F409BA3|nr:hypothetical protein [Streptomyces shenzhenensis]
MPETTQAETPPTSPTASGWCHWHKGVGEDVRVTQVVEAGSGPGAKLSACARCRARRNLVPFADQP